MAGELKDHRIPVMMAATDVATIDEWRRSQEDLPNRSEAIRRLVELGLKANGYQAPRSYHPLRDNHRANRLSRHTLFQMKSAVCGQRQGGWSQAGWSYAIAGGKSVNEMIAKCTRSRRVVFTCRQGLSRDRRIGRNYSNIKYLRFPTSVVFG